MRQEINMRRSKPLSGKLGKMFVLPTALLALGFLVFGCGSSRQSESFDFSDDSMADIGNEQNDINIDEDAEVLRLLGITPNESESPDSTAIDTMQNMTQDVSPEEITELKGELDKKDREITLLRTQLTQKESQISDLTAQLDTRQNQESMQKTASSKSDFKSKYDYALKQYRAKKYQDAISIFSELLFSDAENALSDNCQYWIGESYYGLRNYNQAITEFEKVFLFPSSNKVDDSQLKLGLCYFRLGDKDQARAEFDRLIANYPTSEYKATAQKYLTQL